MLELGVIHREGDGNCGLSSMLGAGGNANQFKLLAKPPHSVDMETKTQQICGAC